jgi:hypothetical protein
MGEVSHTNVIITEFDSTLVFTYVSEKTWNLCVPNYDI